jgi:hypothetical protein
MRRRAIYVCMRKLLGPPVMGLSVARVGKKWPTQDVRMSLLGV